MAEFDQNERTILLHLARAAITEGVTFHKRKAIKLADYSEHLCVDGASFVTLKIAGNLRGCIGSLEAHQPLVQDVAHNAYAAAFQDPRFEPVRADELTAIQIEISVLTQPKPIKFISEVDLLNQIRPGVDGLIMSDAGRRGTFLPAVWEDLPDKQEFLRHLKMKAGFAPDYWSSTIKVARYEAEMFGENGEEVKSEKRKVKN